MKTENRLPHDLNSHHRINRVKIRRRKHSSTIECVNNEMTKNKCQRKERKGNSMDFVFCTMIMTIIGLFLRTQAKLFTFLSHPHVGIVGL